MWWRMSVTEQLLYLVVIPAVVVAVVWALASIGGPQARKRYRPGRPFDFTPVWYLANHRGRAPATDRPQLEAGGAATAGGATGGVNGGASDRW